LLRDLRGPSPTIEMNTRTTIVLGTVFEKPGFVPTELELMAGLRGKALVAYLVVCVFWGSTYLAIRVGVGVLPPFLFAGLRFLIAGLLLLTVVLALGDDATQTAGRLADPGDRGLLLLAGGNAFVVWAEQYTASGVASIFVVTVALWMAFFDAIIPGGSGDLNWRVVTGLLLGFLGTALLVGASPGEILRADLRGPIALNLRERVVVARLGVQQTHRTETSPYVGAAIQMIAGGATIIWIAARRRGSSPCDAVCCTPSRATTTRSRR